MAKLPFDTGFRRRVWSCAPLAWLLMAGSLALAQMPGPGPVEGPMLAAPSGVAPQGPPAEEMVVEVRIEGNRGISKEKILSHIRTRAGRPYDPETIERDVRELNRTRMFVTVKPLSKPVQGGRLVIFQVIERPILKDVKIIGNDGVWTKTLKKEIDLKPGDAADPFAVEEGRRKIEEYYHKKGYSKVRVTIYEGNKPGDLRAIYVINEGPQQKVLWIKFVGNKIASGERLKGQLKTGLPILWIFKGEVDRKQIDEDVERLTAYYRSLGFFRARIGRELEFNEKQDWLVLTFVIDEGPRYKVRNVSFIGNTKFSNEQLAEKTKLKGDQYYNQAQMLADVTAVQDKYGSIGHVFADIKAENRFLDEPGTLDLVYNISEGDRYRVGRINVEIKGENPHTRITTVLNRLSLKPGDIVDTRELRASERRLRASGLFLVDPTRGAQPKIVFNPPESPDKDGESELADRPRRRTSYYRGPAGENGYLPPLPPGERYLDMQLPAGDWGMPEQELRDVGAPPRLPPVADPGAAWGQGPRQMQRYSQQGQQSPPQQVQQAYPIARAAATQPCPGQPYPKQAQQYYDGRDARMPEQTPQPWASGPGAYPAPQNGRLETYPAPAPPPDGPVEPMEPPAVIRGQVTSDVMSDFPSRYPSPTGSVASPGWQAPGDRRTANNGASSDSYRQAPASAPVAQDQNRQLRWGAPATPTAVQQSPAIAYPEPIAGSPGGQNYGAPPNSPPATQDPRYTNPNGAVYGQGSAAGPGNPGFADQRPAGLGPQPGLAAAPPYGPGPTDRVYGDPAYITPSPNGDPLRELPLFVRTEESQTGKLTFGVGVNSDAGVVGQIILDEQNFDWTRFPRGWEDIRNATAWRGAGQKFRIEAVPGTQVQRYMINFQEPYLADSDVSLGLSAFYFDRIYTEWRENRVGGRISLGYQFTHDLTGNIAFRGMNVHLSPYADYGTVPDIAKAVGDNALYGFQATLAHDTRDNAFLATEGHLISLSFEQVVGTFSYPHAEVEASQYFKLYEHPDGRSRHVLSLTGRVGYTGDDTPVFERYYAGGFSTIRGFRFRGVSPMDYSASGLPAAVGGNFEMLASAQYLFPITADDMLRGVVFCDTGTVQPSVNDWSQNYRVAPGFGLRIVIPALGPAPIALDFAFPISKERTDRTEVFSFFVGFNR